MAFKTTFPLVPYIAIFIEFIGQNRKVTAINPQRIDAFLTDKVIKDVILHIHQSFVSVYNCITVDSIY
jgi:hypothetical protein